jgi:hypothetical protein
MLHRQDRDGLIVISQPTHAWLSGQMARRWGNERFAAPPEETCLAAELHDIGFLQWEEAPTLNPATGLPHSFMDLPTRLHLDIWTAGIQQMMRLGRYPALLVSLHFAGLARKHSPGDPEADALTRAFLDAQDEIQTTLLASLRNDFHYAAVSGDETVRRNQQLVSLLDWLSLLLCMKVPEEKSLGSIATNSGSVELKLVPHDDEGLKFAIQPWPFQTHEVSLVCEGRRLLKTYSDEAAMREDLQRAKPITLNMELVRG